MTLPPMRIGQVALTVHDLDGVAAFYEKALGLAPLGRDGEVARLGAGGSVLLELRRDRGARRHGPQEAGLFHTAFLLPDRADLGRWLHHAASLGLRLHGASDHWVSEAVYLADPEGNGIEIYADRPPASWRVEEGMVAMPSEPLDLNSLAASAGTAAWAGAPEGSTVGHVHLQVGDIAAAEAFYAGLLGLTSPAVIRAAPSMVPAATTTTWPAMSGTAVARRRAAFRRPAWPSCRSWRPTPP